jgi:pyrimidine operon attenuation protein/uracil phosphoribosyltransferase
MPNLNEYDPAWIDATLSRLAGEVTAAIPEGTPLAVVGIRTRGSVLAERLAERLRAAGRQLDLGHIDITLYRDDISTGGGRKAIQASEIPFDPNGRSVVLVDDVLSTGRTIRAAMTELMDFGRPARVQLLCLVDRGGRELPIQPDYVGAEIAVEPERRLRVQVREMDGAEGVSIE